MRLSLILESPQQQAEQLSQRLGLSAEEVVIQCNQVSKKYWKWVLQQWYNNKINLPDDSAQIQDILGKFAIVSRRLLPSQKDVNQYQSLEEIQQVVEDVKGVVASSKTHDLSKYIGDGVKVIQKKGLYVTLAIYDVEALKELGEGTRWCTKGSYPECKAQDYIDAFGKVFTVFHNGRPFIQYTPDLNQVKDFNNVDVKDHKLLSYLIPDFKDPLVCRYYAQNVLEERWPEVEPYMMKYPQLAYEYTYYVINRGGSVNPLVRWTEAEPYIMKSPEYAYMYACYIIKNRWIEAEPIIMREPEYAYMYAKYVIRGRWVEAEPYIIRSNFAISYAKDIMQGNWPEAGITL